ncbi:hypothetical protein V6N11_084150 [Hibiscus sabdariffa]|uniref:Uncharacterized protein n=1 Tax=Hibiscus sabdariffa TaxID=183260 RepID=A0ABR1Z752_9ROSI
MNTSRVDEEANQRKDGQIESMQQSRTWVRVEDIGHSAGNETIDRSTKTFVIQEEEMDWVKVSTEQYEEDQVFIDEGFPARDEVAGDCDASDSVEKDDYGGKQNVGPNISTSMENHYVPINVQPLSPTVREQGGHVESLVKANPAGLEGSNLFEVGIASVNSFELRTTFGPGPKGQLQITESDGQSISVSHKSRLQEKAFGSKRKGGSKNDGSAIFRRGRPNCLRANIDRINWRVANSRIRRKSIGGGRKRVEEVWQSGFNFSPRAGSNAIDVGSRKLTMGGYSTLSDAEEVLNLGKNMGVHLADSNDIVLARLAELETEPRAD